MTRGAVICALATVAVASGAIANPPPPPIWPDAFLATFVDTVMAGPLGTYTFPAALAYNFSAGAQRLDHGKGQHDWFCSTSAHGIPIGVGENCTSLIAPDGWWYLYFPEKERCCKCCDREHGCGPIRPGWLQNNNTVYVGQRLIDGRTCDGWTLKGDQVNTLWSDNARSPYGTCALSMTYPALHVGYNWTNWKMAPGPLPEGAFDVPSYCAGHLCESAFCKKNRAQGFDLDDFLAHGLDRRA